MNNFLSEIYTWYDKNKRDLPWRNTTDPYKIWLSEIILQQTRVKQGTAYYLRFVEAFPTVHDLAQASEDEVLKLWQGLGYYSRARNLHATAKIICSSFNRIFPNTYKEIIGLKGVGNYTTAAIASIAFNLPHPTVDGNIYRFFSRYFGIETPIDSTAGKKEFQKLAEDFMNKTEPGYHNQALMEFGALQCTPKGPQCETCPLQKGCYAVSNQMVEILPVKQNKTKQTDRFFYYYLFEKEDSVYLQRRTENDIWKNLYQLPLKESKTEISEADLLSIDPPYLEITPGNNFKSISKVRKHVLSHQIIWAKVIRLEIKDNTHISSDLIRVNKKDISKFAVPRLLELFFDDLKL